MERPTIIIPGAGLGRAIAAFDLRHVPRERARIVMASKGDNFHFNPLVAVNGRKREAIEVKVRRGQAERLYEKLALDLIGAHKLRRTTRSTPVQEPRA
ncbi:hypothetical protein [Brevundimonas sp.]|uniref:hypothetical protein n=1 Tax=Brevundimonas sp. TaxID=1871086 RepID=UPI0027319842|nr:hypothetical protein [Brevundimonas sp.]MDP1914335.1 hypothetical protein [Brevundimonas sp.]